MILQLIGEMLTLIGGVIVAYFIYVLMTKKDDKPSTDSPTMAHTALREIVERAIEEARKLPGLGGGSNDTARVQEGRNVSEHSYEDLLATAILNKVIEKFQREQVDGNSNVLHGKASSKTKCTLSESELGLDEGVEEGSSSLEPLSQDECSSDCSTTHSRRVLQQEPLSLTIEERIEEVTTTYTSDEDHRENDDLGIRNTRRVPFPELGMDIIDPSQESSEDSQDEPDTPTMHMDMVSPVESWEENWLFQKKKVQAQASPVAMLVPNSNADYKALIGDKDAEDTSDLSECSSAQSDEEIEKELMEAIHSVVPRSPKVSESEIDSNVEKNAEPDNTENKDSCAKPENSAKESQVLLNGVNGLEKQAINNAESNQTGTQKSSMEIESKRREREVCKSKDTNNVKGHDKEVTVEISPRKVEMAKKLEEQMQKNGDDASLTAGAEETTKDVSCKSPNNETVQIKPENQKSEECKLLNDCKTSTEENTENGAVLSLEYSDISKSSKEDTERSCSDYNSMNTASTAIQEEMFVSEVPKTPTPTPTRTSMTENSFETIDDPEIFVSTNEIVLNSLEGAKKKLMDANDTLKQETESNKSSSAIQKLDSHAEDEAQQESEYTEHYDIATQRHLDSLTKGDGSSLTEKTSRCREAAAIAKAASASHQSTKGTDETNQLTSPPRPGTIAEREHKKWENAPPIENNPYSEENIQRRLWERQYSRRSSDIPGVHAELPKANGTELDVVLEPNQPDITRFGRDYYINDSKIPSGERMRRTTVSSRPSSSLSQRSSGSIGVDHEQQEESQSKESESVGRCNDVKSKVAKWQKNNAEMNSCQLSQRNSQICNAENTEEKYLRKNDAQKTWQSQRVEEILENERKNNKNEINAKLNNQETSILETKKSYSDENQRKIRRIDLKAYGFENDFFRNSDKTIKSQRVVNKLDLKSFGYDDGLRRTQSNNHLDSTVNGDLKPRIVRLTNKSNLTRHGDYRNGNREIGMRGSGDCNFTQSTETLDNFRGDTYVLGTMTSAKSVPNISKCEYYTDSSNDVESEDSEVGNVTENLVSLSTKSLEGAKCGNEVPKSEVKNGDVSNDSENDTDEASEKKQLSQNEVPDNKADSNGLDNVKLPMPSVRRLAEAFSKQSESAPVVPKMQVTKPSPKERSSTPEIHIVETPKQMHSLTARSLSKQFREGLRQIPNKVTSPPASHATMEQLSVSEAQTEVVQSKGDNPLNDTDVISPGKLKSNIIFWEQMQKRS